MRVHWWLALLLLPAFTAGAQVAPDASVTAALANLSARAATAFVGQVTAIRREAGVVEVVFRVDTPVLGQAGGTYTLREWAGMWPPGMQRYRLGERALVFLHAASSAGLSSAVDGGEGVVPVMSDANGTVLLDVRRLATRVLRQVGQPLVDGNGAMALSDALPVIQSRGLTTTRPVRRPLPPAVTPVVPVGTKNPTKPAPVEELTPIVQ
ncbi:MAG TPA: hypothetical protein VMD97_03330 [Candidatus Aquilonibacter sp.]|nr:hypothetical protein [Candidatus Aquilonibacter sp.]